MRANKENSWRRVQINQFLTLNLEQKFGSLYSYLYSFQKQYPSFAKSLSELHIFSQISISLNSIFTNVAMYLSVSKYRWPVLGVCVCEWAYGRFVYVSGRMVGLYVLVGVW